MRVAVLSHDGLPDPRVERELATLVGAGMEPVLITTRCRGASIVEDFKCLTLPYRPTSKVNIGFEPWRTWARKALSKLLASVRPDVVLAVNLWPFVLSLPFGYPTVLDDHELLSLRYLYQWPRERGISYAYKVMKAYKGELSAVVNGRIITVSKRAALHYVSMGAGRVYVVENFPTREEYSRVTVGSKCIDFMYVGSDIFGGVSHRDNKPLISAAHKAKVQIHVVGIGESADPAVVPLGRASHMSVYRYISMAKFGLMVYRPHMRHVFTSANKVAMYMAGGAKPILTCSFIDMIERLEGNAIVVPCDDFERSLVDVLRSALDMETEPAKLSMFARERLVWDEKEFLSAVKSA